MYYDVYPFYNESLLLSYDEIAFDEVPASEFILMQSTGFKDRSGLEIFESDVVSWIDSDGILHFGVVELVLGRNQHKEKRNPQTSLITNLKLLSVAVIIQG